MEYLLKFLNNENYINIYTGVTGFLIFVIIFIPGVINDNKNELCKENEIKNLIDNISDLNGTKEEKKNYVKERCKLLFALSYKIE